MAREKKALPEGAYFNKYMFNRFRANKNIIITITGSTGSGKTYSALKICEDWYKFKFEKDFPVNNICFSLEQVARRLKDRNLKRGELLILEEAGANLGAGDFQTKISKIFSYILQSFRSMNIGLVLTLPVLSMLNKSARQLLHIHMTTEGLTGGQCKLKIKIHQLNQHSGKSYWKAPIIKYNGSHQKMPYVFLSLAAKPLRDEYEVYKEKFVYALVDGFEENIKTKEQKRAEAQAQEREYNIKKDEWVLAHAHNKNNKIICVNCAKPRLDVNKNNVKCRACGHVEHINIII